MTVLFRLAISAIAIGSLAACAFGSAPTVAHAATNALYAVSTDPQAIPSSFFAMTTVNGNDYPKLTFGTLGHPEIGAWAWIERSEGTYDFTLFDRYVHNAMAHGLVDANNTVSMAITLGMTPPWAAADPSSCITNKGVPRCTCGPSKIQDWSNFVTATFATHAQLEGSTLLIISSDL